MLIGYSKDDRILDPAGALRSYEAGPNSKRDLSKARDTSRQPNAGGPRLSRPVVFPTGAAKTLGQCISLVFVPVRLKGPGLIRGPALSFFKIDR